MGNSAAHRPRGNEHLLTVTRQFWASVGVEQVAEHPPAVLGSLLSHWIGREAEAIAAYREALEAGADEDAVQSAIDALTEAQRRHERSLLTRLRRRLGCGGTGAS